MKSLRKLNLNSTNLSALTFEGLKVSFAVAIVVRGRRAIRENRANRAGNQPSWAQPYFTCFALFSPKGKLPCLQEVDVRYTDAW